MIIISKKFSQLFDVFHLIEQIDVNLQTFITRCHKVVSSTIDQIDKNKLCNIFSNIVFVYQKKNSLVLFLHHQIFTFPGDDSRISRLSLKF